MDEVIRSRRVFVPDLGGEGLERRRYLSERRFSVQIEGGTGTGIVPSITPPLDRLPSDSWRLWCLQPVLRRSLFFVSLWKTFLHRSLERSIYLL